MNTNQINKTGYNPNINAYSGTSNESIYYETTSVNECLSSIIKNEHFIIEDTIYSVTDNVYIDTYQL